MKNRIHVTVPELHLSDIPLRASVWHVEVGQTVEQGDRLLEISAGDVIVDLPSPAAGVLRRRLVQEDDLLSPGQAVAVIEPMRG